MGRHRYLLTGLAITLTGLAITLLSMSKKRGATTTIALGVADAEESVDVPRISSTELATPPRACWIFNHLNKAGGSTVKYMLKPWAEKYNISLGQYDSPEWQGGPEAARQYLRENNTITWGAYTDGLRPYVGQDCKWFTIFRHPVERLVSAYFYCKKSPKDGMCATEVLRADEVDLVTFARHWGNFGLRQFLYGDVAVADMDASQVDDPLPESGKRYPGWWEMKRYLERLAVNRSTVAAAAARSAETLTSVEYPVLKTFLAQVKKRLNQQYAAVGVIENWPTTLRLFDATLQLPSYDWKHSYHSVGKKNINHKFLNEVGIALQAARADPDIQEFIRLDILLYEHAVEVHAKQLKEYGIGDD